MNNNAIKGNQTQKNEIICSIREPIAEDEDNFIVAMCRSQTLHSPWVVSPQTIEEFKNYLKHSQQNNQKSFLVLNQIVVLNY